MKYAIYFTSNAHIASKSHILESKARASEHIYHMIFYTCECDWSLCDNDLDAVDGSRHVMWSTVYLFRVQKSSHNHTHSRTLKRCASSVVEQCFSQFVRLNRVDKVYSTRDLVHYKLINNLDRFFKHSLLRE